MTGEPANTTHVVLTGPRVHTERRPSERASGTDGHFFDAPPPAFASIEHRDGRWAVNPEPMSCMSRLARGEPSALRTLG
jgi:hypothetical protein